MTLPAPGLPKRIAIVAPSLAGILRDRANLMRALTTRGHKVLAAGASHLAGEVAALHHLGGEHRNFDPRPAGLAIFANRKVIQALRGILFDWQADTVVVSGRDLASLAATAARKAGAKRIVTIVGGLGNGGVGRRAEAQRYRRAVMWSDSVVVHNEDDGRVVQEVLQVPWHKLIFTPGDGVDVEAFQALPLPAQDQPLTFVMIADPDQRAGIEAYIAAAQTLRARGSAARFQLATDREAAQDTAFLTADGVAFLGRAAEPAGVLAAAHVAVHLSADDGSPTALKQALAAGRPVLTLDVPGCREAADERVNGCVVAPDDPGALVAALESFVVHRDLLPAEARAARAKAVQAFDRKRVLEPVILALEA